MRQNFPGFPGFGMMLIGDDWKGPMRFSISALVKGPRYQPFANSLLIILLKCSSYRVTDGWFGGV